MTSALLTRVCLSYILGLLWGWFGLRLEPFPNYVLILAPCLFAGFGAIATHRKIRVHNWFLVAVIMALAVFYLRSRIPQPPPNDISFQVTGENQELREVWGTVLDEPRLNSNQRYKFFYRVTGLSGASSVAGKLYVTLPLLQGTGIHSGQELEIKGILYTPQGAANLGGFDFQKYLARNGVFAGLRGMEISYRAPAKSSLSWWQVRQRIVQSHLRGLGSPLGQLISSMVLGRKAVDLPEDIRNDFVIVGLAHVLAASGFHVSLLLGIISKSTESLSPRIRSILSGLSLAVYLGITGMQASVLRACLMGITIILSWEMERKIKPLGALLLVGTAILLWNPLFIRELGFQLSFLATLGLLTTLEPIQRKLEWLPSTVATLVAVPLAASLWVLPLLTYSFNTVATYGLIVNIFCTPLVTIISLGGMLSGILALISPWLGSIVVGTLFYPIKLLLYLINLVANFPGSVWMVGQVSFGIVILIYGVYILIWRYRWWHKRWWLGLLLIFMMLVLPQISLAQRQMVTLFQTQKSQIALIQDQGQIILINSGSTNQAKYAVLPYLARQGINHIDYGLLLDTASNSPEGWELLKQRFKIRHFDSAIANSSLFETDKSEIEKDNFHVNKKQLIGPINDGTDSLSRNFKLDKTLGVAAWRLQNTIWLFISNAHPGENRVVREREVNRFIQQLDLENKHSIIVWSGDTSLLLWLKLLQPHLVIATEAKIEPQILSILQNQQIPWQTTALSGMLRWTSQEGLVDNKNNLDNNF